MKFLVSLMLIFISCFALAKEDLILKKYNQKVTLLEMDEINYELQQHGYWPMDVTLSGAIPFLEVDQIFYNTKTDKSIYFIYGMESNIQNKFLKVDTHSAYFTKTLDNTPVGVYFENSNSNEAQQIVKNLWVEIERMPASSSCSSCKSSSFNDIKKISSNLSSSLDLQNIYSCLIDSVKKQYKETKSSAASLFKSILNPIESIKKTIASGREFINVVLNIKSKISTVFKNLFKLNLEFLKYLGCQIAKEIGLQIISMIALGGLAAFKAPLMFKKISDLIDKAYLLIKKNNLPSNKNNLEKMKESISCDL